MRPGGWQLALALLEELKNFSVEADVISNWAGFGDDVEW